MPKHYNIDFKKSAVELIKNGASTIKTADDLNVPLKTLENWITAYNKDPHVFDRNYVSPGQQIKKLEKQVKQKKLLIS